MLEPIHLYRTYNKRTDDLTNRTIEDRLAVFVGCYSTELAWFVRLEVWSVANLGTSAAETKNLIKDKERAEKGYLFQLIASEVPGADGSSPNLFLEIGNFCLPPPPRKNIYATPMTEHVALQNKLLCKNMTRANGDAKEMRPLSWGRDGKNRRDLSQMNPEPALFLIKESSWRSNVCVGNWRTKQLSPRFLVCTYLYFCLELTSAVALLVGRILL